MRILPATTPSTSAALNFSRLMTIGRCCSTPASISSSVPRDSKPRSTRRTNFPCSRSALSIHQWPNRWASAEKRTNAGREGLVPRYLVQPCKLRFGLSQQSCVGIGVFPDHKEIPVGSLGVGVIPGQRIGPRQSEAGECTNGLVSNNSGLVNNLLELARCGTALLGRQVRLAAQVDRIERKSESGIALAQFM